MSLGNAYVVTDTTWNDLPGEVRKAAKNRIEKISKIGKGKGFTVVLAPCGKVPTRINFNDAVVRIYPNSKHAAVEFRRHVYNQLNSLSRLIPELNPLKRKFLAAKYKIDVGRSFILKWAFKRGNKTILACVTEGVVSLHAVYVSWVGIFKKKTNLTLPQLSQAPKDKQASFGIALGNVIAHELRHQLGPSKTGAGLGHSGHGLGKDGADFSSDSITITRNDQKVILRNVFALKKMQSGRPTERVVRHANK